VNWKHILLTGDIDFIEKGERGALKKGIAEIERILKALIKSFEKKLLTLGILDPSSPTELEKNQKIDRYPISIMLPNRKITTFWLKKPGGRYIQPQRNKKIFS